ncbi:type II toxin-antitoxin system RelE/ParE family toxin [Flavobacterium paronense]|uniref:Type II toxin-antitoxin system RelE/ParE family toxin n=1 Tax=Flavobacterium paronense TaxID=1392775 RepID=A0ABV5GGU1_9FLAO|nr:type II toxin-antitoxin system RelE/ParE family toxin [Flavobacterium paronense]MDN3677232.1 type II toxin-antitoxin system RelE/ParE family toxin [Flavobacterium paronense]
MESKIIWSINALKELEDIHFYLLFESKSITIADKVIEAIFDSTIILKKTPEIYKLDKLKKNNDGTFRTYFIYDFQISYRINPAVIQVLRIRHNARKPKKI